MIALITGSSRGIGKAIARQLARDYQADLFLIYKSNQDAADAVAKECIALGANAQTWSADVSEAEAATAAVKECITRFGGLDVLVNNAGITADGLSMRMSVEDWGRVQATNSNSMFYTTKAAVRTMMKARSGRIINLSSIAAKRPNKGQVNYAASKGAVEAFTRALAVELGSRNITVNAVAPGIIETEMSEAIRSSAGDEIRGLIPLGRFGQAAEVATLVSFLAGPDSTYLPGQINGVDGGLGM